MGKTKRFYTIWLMAVMMISGFIPLLPALPAAAAVTWSQTFSIEDKLDIYDFPEELLNYNIAPALSSHVDKNHLKVTDQAGNVLEYQLSNVVLSGADLQSATISFRSDLPKGASRKFVVAYDSAYTPSFTQHVNLTSIDAVNHTAVISANQQEVKVPYGPITYSPAVSASSALAPLLALRYSSSDSFIGSGTFAEITNAKYTGFTVSSVTTSIVEQGPLYMKYRIVYTFSGSRSYMVELTVRYNEKYVGVDEYLSGFDDADYIVSGNDNGGGLFYRFDYTSGLDPTGRLVMSNNGYNADTSNQFSGLYGKNIAAPGSAALSGKLPYELGLFAVNSFAIMRSTVFWNETAGSEALQFAVYRPKDWHMDHYLVYNSPSFGNLRFYETGSPAKKLMQTRLEGTERHWAISAIPHSDLVISGNTEGSNVFQTYNIHNTTSPSLIELDGYPTNAALQFGAGVDVRLWQKLTDFSLDKYKDLVLDGFAEDLNETLDLPDKLGPITVQTYDQWSGLYFKHIKDIADKYWDWSSGNEGIGRGLSIYIQNYAASRMYWTQSQRDHAKALFLFLAYCAEDESWHPYVSMLSGHANFIADNKQILGMVTAVFRHHPHAAAWKAAYQTYFNSYLDAFVRAADPANDALAGRHTENLATYNFASLQPALHAAYSIRQFDGTEVMNDNRVKDWLTWILNTMEPVENNRRFIPSQGAHASTVTPYGAYPDAIGETARFIRPIFPQLADNLLWSQTVGTGSTEGVQPSLDSALFTDYGAVMRYDMGGPNEAYVNLQQLNGQGYRWGANNNGGLFYSSKGNRWSWNGEEDSGDTFDITKLSAVSMSNGTILNAAPISNVLYNFDFAQFYSVPNGSTGSKYYTARDVMMVRDDYLAVYDDLLSNSYTATFNWNRQTSGIWGEYYNNTSLTGVPVTRLDKNIQFNWIAGTSPIAGVGNTFSTRWTSTIQPQYSENYTFNIAVNKGDKVKVWVNNTLMIDQWATAATANTIYTSASSLAATANQYYDVKVEYAHTDNTAHAQPVLRWNSTSQGNAVIPALRIYYPIKNFAGASTTDASIYSIKGGSGDILNLVAGQALSSTAALTVGGVTVGSKVNGTEYAYTSDTATTYSDATSGFTGKFGYAKDGQLAIFNGTAINYNGFQITLPSGATFGASAQKRDNNNIVGRIAGTATAQTLKLTAPSGFNLASGVTVKVNNTAVTATVVGSDISFPVTVAPSDGYKTYSIQSTGTTAGADLIITDVIASPTTFVPGDKVDFTVVVKNQGTVDTNGGVVHHVKINVNGSGANLYATSDVASLAPGRSVMIRMDTPWTATTAGSKTVNAYVDDNGQIAESNETNNAYSTSITVNSALPDLVVGDIQWPQAYQSQYIWEKNAVAFKALITNKGTAATGAVSHRVGFKVDGGSTIVWSDNFVTPLAPGESKLVTVNNGTGSISTWSATAGTHTITAEVDDLNTIAESNETNNTFSKTLLVGHSLVDWGFDSSFANTSATTNPFKVSTNNGGSTSIVSINGTNNAVEFRDNNAAGNGAGSTFTATVSSGNRLVDRINEVYRRPSGDPTVYFLLSFNVERRSASPVMVPTSTYVDIQSVPNNDPVIPRFLVAQTGITATTAYSHDEASGSEVLEPVTYKDLTNLKFAVTPNGGTHVLTGLSLEFSTRVGGTLTTSTDEAYAIDDIAFDEVGQNLLQGDFDADMDSPAENGIVPFAAADPNSGGSSQIVSFKESLTKRNTAAELTDTTAGSSGAGVGTKFVGTLSAGKLLDRINQIFAMATGSTPVDFILAFNVERRDASSSPVTADIKAGVEFVNTSNVSSFPTGATDPSFYSTSAYSNDEPFGSEVLQNVSNSDIAAYRFTVTPDSGATVLKAIKLNISNSVNTGATPEAFAIDNVSLSEVLP